MSGTIIKSARNTPHAPQDLGPCTQTVAFSHYNNISAQLPVDPATGKMVSGDVTAQARQCLSNLKAIIESIGHVMDDMVKATIFLKDISDLEAVNAVYREFFPGYLPTRTTLAVAALPLGALVQIDAIISNGEGTFPQAPCPLVKLARNSARAPQDSLSTQTVAFSHYNNIGAQLPVEPASGALIGGGIREQAAQCLHNIKAVLEGIDVPFDDIVKVTVYLTNLADLDAINEVYTTFFPDSAIARAAAYMPARSVIAASALPMGALVQMDAVISHGDGTPPQLVEDRHNLVIRPRNTDKAPRSPLHTQTVAFSHYNHIAGQLPVDLATGKILTGCVREQTAQCLSHIKAIVESIGHVMDDIVKVNIQLANIADLDAVNAVYTKYFPGYLPARTVIGVSELPAGALVQMDAVMSNAESTPPQA
ncbi:reactive intermediate/imine deaminase [Aeromonas veronii]|uniref:RidA family protein n=1 Tax=Aeromonas veronii TaxID=654 RepID=UPI00071882A6|nr:RidA family protein [Aeromonas veronii]EKP0246100.1 reactive intermediate/imine deaminase [Aeromonas veronii]KRV69205.1 reactive intermediate/imine deaminase [Aeromonas veronii]KRV70981.1 reactive intermediate/imine deaminase [Aeromonas veronii]KRV87280.1 reactive intermediate/imine deaminase [Aeromonas veronii]KRV90359.1 reactive intermediate/imine deaminase [Aeromonas veronii]